MPGFAKLLIKDLNSKIQAVGRVLEENGCDCPNWEEEVNKWDICVACKVKMALTGKTYEELHMDVET